MASGMGQCGTRRPLPALPKVTALDVELHKMDCVVKHGRPPTVGFLALREGSFAQHGLPWTSSDLALLWGQESQRDPHGVASTCPSQ